MTARTMDDIAEMLEKMKFRKKLFGGVEEQDVWRQLDALQKAYRSVYDAQAVRYETILEQHGIRTTGNANSYGPTGEDCEPAYPHNSGPTGENCGPSYAHNSGQHCENSGPSADRQMKE